MAGIVEALSQAIAKFEGYYQPGTIAARNRNPGNLRGGRRQTGVDASGYGIYASDSDGWADLADQVNRNINRGLTLSEFFGGKPGVYPGYAPAADKNDPNNYARFVAQQTGIAPDVPLLELGGDRSSLVIASPAAAAAPSPVETGPAAAFPWLSAMTGASATPAGPWVWVALAVAAGAAAYLWWDG